MAKNRDSILAKQKTFNIVNPISDATNDGVFKMTRTSLDKYKSNLYTLLFTNVGERPMMPNFGTNLRGMLFDPETDGIFENIKSEIIDKTKFWIPQLVIQNVEFGNRDEDIENNKISLKINFYLKNDPTIQDMIEIEGGVLV